MDDLTRLRAVAYLEATTYLVLLAAAVNRRAFDGPDLASVLGPLHGIVFLALGVLVIQARVDHGWDLRRTLTLFGMALVPGGGYFAERHLRPARAA